MSTAAVPARLNEIQRLCDLYKRELDDIIRYKPFIIREQCDLAAD